MSIKKPGFFILGAPKCGTTSLDAWLKSHPLVFTARKEPNYFNTKGFGMNGLPQYESLFEGATGRHLAVGETSPKYLRCPDAVANILRYNPRARFIVMVRDPVEMAYSWHSQMLYNDNENVKDFEAAWNLQDERRAGRRLPRFCYDADNLLYGEVCSVGKQLQRVYQQAPGECVHVVVFDDLKADAAGVYRSVLEFLGVPDEHQPLWQIHNPSVAHRLPHLNRPLMRVHEELGKWKTALGIRRSFHSMKWVDRLNRYNTRPHRRPPLPPRLRGMLAEYFHDDVQLLERLTGRDLSHWRR